MKGGQKLCVGGELGTETLRLEQNSIKTLIVKKTKTRKFVPFEI